ncbi:hypothetical protein CGMCC3_g13050 [Colletotrichum fructicola]|nr:uncharacterized protein CGMCC3_g13050 [Colletotrichum fructicola]KAE9570898.1 hypothetical protein CGMCC3_g13050 [Colletotrichum fructicola]
MFSQNSDKKKHLSQPIACDVVEGITADGFDSDQEKDLRSKKRKRNNLKTEEDKWGHIFRILFGDSVAVPQPYYTYHTADNARSESQSGQGDLLKMTPSDVERVLSQDVPRDLEEQTFSQVEAISGRPLPRAKRRQMLGIFRRLFVKQLKGTNESANPKEDVPTGNGPRSTFHTNHMAGTSGINSSTMPTHGAQLTPESRGQTSSQALSLRDEIVVEGRTSMDSGQALVHSTFVETDDGCNYDLWPTDTSLGTYGTFDEFYRVSDDFWAMASANGFQT